jgi:hypothetical protein
MNKRHGHLIPLDGRGTNLYIGYWDFLKKVTPKSGYGLSSVYIWPSFTPGIYLSIYQTEDEKSYYLLYAINSKPQTMVKKLAVPAEFAKDFEMKLTRIIESNTYYLKGMARTECTDHIEYIFESDNLYGSTDCPPGELGDNLEQAADNLIDLAKMQSHSEEVKNKKMGDILKLLDESISQ